MKIAFMMESKKRRAKMTTNNKVWVTGENQFCKEILRYHTLLYVIKDKKEYYASASCTNFNNQTNEPFEYAVEFLDYTSMNIIAFPYDMQLFKQIEEMAIGQFREMKDEEKLISAV